MRRPPGRSTGGRRPSPEVELEVVGRCLGSPLGAACSGYVVWSPGAVVLLDCGPGILERLWARGILPRLDAVVISHAHQDHCLDLVPLSNAVTQEAARVGEGGSPLPVYVPRDRGPEVLRTLGLALAGDARRFVDAFDLHEYDARDAVRVGSLRLTFAPTEHPEPCFAVRISDGVSSLVYGADGAPSDGLEALAASADVLLVEASLVERTPELEPYGHMTGAEAGELARRAGVGRLVLTHLQPWVDGHDAENLRRAAAGYDGPIDLAVETMRVPVGSSAGRPGRS